jgi:predicted nucleotidyltransferase
MPATTATVPDSVWQLVDQIVAEFRPRRVILFGSHAAGTAHAESDVDLLVVKETTQSLFRESAAIYRAIERDVPMDVLVRTPEQVAARNPRDLILRTILDEGITVYEASD